MAENWKLCNGVCDVEGLVESLKLNELTIRLLANRGYTKETDIKEYLFPSFDYILPNNLLT